MSKEFHVFTHHDPSYEQAFVFEVERHEDDVEFRDLYMLTTTKHGELKTRIQFDQMIQSVVNHEGGNVEDSSVSVIVDMFKDLIPDDKRLEISQEINDRQIYNMDPQALIDAVEYATIIEHAERIDNETNTGTSQETQQIPRV